MKFKIIEKEEEKMEELLEILNEIDDSIDYENETALIDDQLLDSFAIITLVSELEDAFDISIEASEMHQQRQSGQWYRDFRKIKISKACQ
mgnify:CR=1 FL=1